MTSRATWKLVLGLVAAGCSRGGGGGADATATAATEASAVPIASASAAVVADAATAEDDARRIVALWSDALDRHDVVALAALYAPRVRFYGQDLPKSAVLDRKRRALGPTSKFHQSIGEIALAPGGDGLAATFQKHSGEPPQRDVRAKIVIVDGHIREESDEPTAKPGRARCLEVAAAVVMALPEVKKTLGGAEKEIAKAHDGRRMGGMGPQDDEGPGLSVSLGVHHDDRYERLVDYEVNAAGRLTVTVAADEIAVPAAAASKVEQACKAL